VRLEGLDELKNPETSTEIEPGIFQLEAQCLSRLGYCVSGGTDELERIWKESIVV
jgi:hypothetical protein